MKSIKIAFAILAFAFISISCSKSDNQTPTVYPEENFWQGFINNAGYSNPTPINTGNNMGYGLQFKPKVKGKINSFVVKLPQTGSVWITLKKGDLYTTSIYEENFNVTTSNTDFLKVITPIELEKDTKYYLIVVSTNYFEYNRTSSNQAVISGNIEIDGTSYASNGDSGSGLSNFSNSFNDIWNEMYGNVSFNFQRTE